MSFSLRWLFALVALAGLFSSALTLQNAWWSGGMVVLALAILFASVVGLSLRMLDKAFWLPFCVVGWGYMMISFSVPSVSRLSLALPTTRAAFELWFANQQNPLAVDKLYAPYNTELSHYQAYLGNRLFTTDADQLYNFLTIVHSLFTLIFAFAAGVVASYCVRRSKIAEHQ